ncbi:MAG: hypothetical protein ABI894_03915 [Ilumatobacteraceae bacterium]
MDTPTVPDVLFGCWTRAWIEFSDGTIDDTSTVVWLQTESSMVDVRVASDRPNLTDRAGLHECSIDELRAIAASDASSGFTECGPIVVDGDGVRTATATWHTHGHGVNFQPVSASPEPGLMLWSDDGTVMTERATSGAYVEEWRLLAGSRDPLSVTTTSGNTMYRAGDIAVLVRDRAVAIPRQARLLDLLDEYAHDRQMIEALLDCEFSVSERGDDEWTVVASTLPWREGKVLDVDLS